MPRVYGPAYGTYCPDNHTALACQPAKPATPLVLLAYYGVSGCVAHPAYVKYASLRYSPPLCTASRCDYLAALGKSMPARMSILWSTTPDSVVVVVVVINCS